MALKSAYHRAASYAAACLVTALLVVPSFWAFLQIKGATKSRHRTHESLLAAESLRSSMKGAEAAQRSFLLTGDETFLEPYAALQGGMQAQLEILRQQNESGPARNHLEAVAPLIDAKWARMSHVIELRRSQGAAAARAAVATGEGERLMVAIGAEMAAFTQVEQSTLAWNEASLQSRMNRLVVILAVFSGFALLAALSFVRDMYRQTGQRLKDQVHLETGHLLEMQEEMNGRLVQSNTTLQESEEKLAVTLDSIGDAVIATDTEARVRLMNPVAERLTGWTSTEAQGEPVDVVFRIINQETRQPAVTPVMATLKHGTIQGLANHTVLIARDGSECAIADSCAPIRGRDGGVSGAVLVFRDVTQEYAAQQALRDSSALVQAILSTVVDGIITIQARTGLIETVNPAVERIFGYSANDLQGQNIGLLIPQLDQTPYEDSLQRYRAGDEARVDGLGREVMGRRKDGAAFSLEVVISDMWLGGQRYFTGILRDNTARKLVEAERERLDQILKDRNAELIGARVVADQANLAKSEFLSSMSHELRSPLNAILGFAQLMDSALPPATPTQKASIDRILHAGWYLLELINEILDLAVIESGKLAMSQEPVSLGEVMHDCQSMIEPQGENRGITLTFPEFNESVFLHADRVRLKQILLNLLSNAIKYNRPGGKVIVGCASPGLGRIRISVRDTGHGLAPEQLRQLFQPFNRLGQEHGKEEGTGIGLVMSKLLVEMMGGALGVESVVGEGSLFWYDLNTSEAPILQESRLDTAGLLKTPDSSGVALRTVLCIEDNPANLDLIQQLIARRPELRLLSAVNANLGLDLARRAQPEVILMDINLPGINGIEALRMLRESSLTAHIPAIAISANAMLGDIKRGMDAGFFRYLTKPINVNEFMDALDQALGHAKNTAAGVN